MNSSKRSKPRIVFATLETYALVGGLQNFNRRVISNLVASASKAAAPEPRVLTLRDGDSIPSDLRSIVTSSPHRLSHFIRCLIEARNADLLIIGHVNLLPLALIARCLQWRLPILLFVHGDEVWNDPRHRTKRWYEEYLLIVVDRVASVSRYTANVMSKEFGVPAAKFSIFPNAVDPITFAPSRIPGPPTILTVTRMNHGDREKNVDCVIEAVAKLQVSIPGVRYEIVGSGSLIPELKALAAKKGASEIVRFLGRLTDDELSEAYERAQRVRDAFFKRRVRHRLPRSVVAQATGDLQRLRRLARDCIRRRRRVCRRSPGHNRAC
ncbi:phosphatidylinositol alpha-1,6-mannosyltransferase [Bradyrhizobium sp. GM7.3]